MLWEDFVRYTRRFGWSLDRTRQQFRLMRGGNLRNRWANLEENFALDEYEVPDDWTLDDLDRIEFDNDGYEEIYDGEEINMDDLGDQVVPDIDNVETEPLLGGATGTGAVGGTGLGATNFALGIGLAVAAGTGAGILVSRDTDDNEKEKKRPTVTLPDHNYLGPGNDEHSGLPVHDLDDEIAREHDESYGKAKDDKDVKDADDKAIHDFTSDFIETGNPHSALGAIGLSVKRKVETKTGVLYPKTKGLYFLYRLCHVLEIEVVRLISDQDGMINLPI